MDLNSKFREIGAKFLLCLSVTWPIGHLFLSQQLGFSPWRFFGWGMYSVPHPETLTSLQVFVALDEKTCSDELRRSILPEQTNAKFLEVYSTQVDGFKRETADLLVQIFHLQSKKAMNQLFEFIGSRLPENCRSSRVFFSHTKQRLRLSQRRLYTSSRLFLLRDGELQSLGEYDSHTNTLNQTIKNLVLSSERGVLN